MLKYQKKKSTVLLHGLSLVVSGILAALSFLLGSIGLIPQSMSFLNILILALSLLNILLNGLRKQPWTSSFPHQEIALFTLWLAPLTPLWSNHINGITTPFFIPWSFVLITYIALFYDFKNKNTYLLTYSAALITLFMFSSLSAYQHKITYQTLCTIHNFFNENVALLLAVVLSIYASFANNRRQRAYYVEKKLDQETEERLKTEEILLNTLPLRIILRLKKGEQVIADRFSNATILFADLVGFTEMANKVTPTQLFRMINKIFLQFDEITNKKYLQKIKTNGDSYMVAGGISSDSPRNAALASVELAIRMRTLISELSKSSQQKLQLRVGVSTGPVVAGILGSRKFIFDVWGDTVNIASRLSSEGNPQSILIDEFTYKMCQKPHWFEEPHDFWLKGKGQYLAYAVKEKLVYRPR